MRTVITALCIALLAVPVFASELFVSVGGMSDSKTGDQSYAWSIDYFQGISENFAFSIGHTNEGHVPNHHRDGQSVMLWGRTNLLDRRLSLAVGAGSYFYFDTSESNKTDYQNNHNFGLITSLAATWYTDSPILLQLRANSIYANKNFDSYSLLFGIGYQLETPQQRGPLPGSTAQDHKTTNNEIAVYLGKTIVNSMNSEASLATCVEYRRGLMTYLDGSIAWMNEGKNDVLRRNGIIAELWLTRDFLNEKLALAFGVGGYFALDKYKGESQGGGNQVASALSTLSISYRILPSIALRAHWNRMITGYDRDADVIMAGIGYRF